jgi:O-antigen ligase
MAGFYVALYIVRPWEELLPWLADIHFERVYALCMIAVVLCTGKLRLSIDAQTGALFLFLLALTLSALFAVDSSLAWDPWYSYLALIVFYLILRVAIRTPYELVFMVVCYIGSMAAYLAKAQWEFFLYDRHDRKMEVTRLIGLEDTFGDPNALAMSIAVSLPLLLFLFANRKQVANSWPGWLRLTFALGLAGYALLAFSSIILTRSRAGMLTAVVFVGLSAMRGQGWRRKLLATFAGLVGLAIVWFAMSDEARNRLRTVWDPEAGPANATESAYGRIAGLQAGLAMLQEFPLTGVGLGNFIPYRLEHLDGVSLVAHNLLGQVLGETGLLGAGFFALMVAVMLYHCRTIRRLAKNSWSVDRGANAPRPTPHAPRPTPHAPRSARLTILSSFATACQNAIFLLLFEGVFLHNLLRFNWVWLAAFTGLALGYARQPRPLGLGLQEWPRQRLKSLAQR